jgi:membrane peptidoglycan carboxypeptidase
MMQDTLWYISLKFKCFFEEVFHIIWRYQIWLGIDAPKFLEKLENLLPQGNLFFDRIRIIFKWIKDLFKFFLFLIVGIISVLSFLIWRKIVLLFIFIGIFIYTYPITASYFVFEDYNLAHKRFHGTGVYDKTDKFLGIIPATLDPQSAVVLSEVVNEDHKSLYITQVPEGWWDVLKALEDRHIDNRWRSWAGIDIIALAQRSFEFLAGRNQKGASTLAMMLVRSIRHENADPNDPFSKKLKRKYTEIRDAPVLFHKLYPHDFKIWLAMHVPLAKGTLNSHMGGSLYGLGITARVVFGKPPEKLTVAEQALLAAAFKRPILLAPENDKNAQKNARDRWEYLKKRAKDGVKIAYPIKYSDIFIDIDKLKFPKRPHGPVRLERLLPPDEIKRFGKLASPYKRSFFWARDEMIQAIGELQERYGMKWRDKVYALHLNTEIIDNVNFKRQVEQVLQKLQTKLQKRGRLRLNFLRKNNGETAQVLLALAGPDGRLLRYYSNSDNTIYSGEQTERENGRYLPEKESRQIASLGKLPAAVFLGAAGDNPNKATYCNKAINEIQNASGKPKGVTNCSVKGAKYKPRTVFARSLNLPLINRLNKASQKELELLLKRFGLTLTQKDKDSTPLSTALTLGLVTASPHTLHGIMHAIVTGIANGTPTALQPTLVRKVQIIKNGVIQKREMPAMNNPNMTKIAHYFANPKTGSFVKTVLSGVLKKKWGGTLSALEDWTHEKNPNVELHIAKTGTSTLEKNIFSKNSPILDKYIVGGLVWRGKPYSYFVLVGHSEPSKPLGEGMSGNDLSELVRVMLRNLP